VVSNSGVFVYNDEMPRGRVKGTKLSDAHKLSLSKALRGNIPWNKGNTTEPIPGQRLSKEERALVNQAKAEKAGKTRKKNTALKYIMIAEETGVWTNVTFSTENKIDYLALTHTCGETIKVQVQTVRKWSFGEDLCKRCNPVFRGTSKAELELTEFVRTLAPDMLSHQKINGLELDAVVLSKKLAFEYDGLYWHSERAGYPNTKHLLKTKMCLEQGLQLIHVFEDEYVNKREIVQSRIRAALGASKKLYARKMTLDLNVSTAEAREFIDRTHLQGYVNSTTKIGLRLGGALMSLMTFGKPRYNKKYDWELLRFSSELNCTVVGGASRLLAAFRKIHKGSLISYADRRWSTGNVYKTLGFELVGESPPAYHYFKGDLRQNRQTFQKAKLKMLMPEIYDEKKTEAEMMFEAGWNRIWDCGNLVFELKDDDFEPETRDPHLLT
jgi:hypothetical protein